MYTGNRLGDVAELTMVDEGLIHEGHLNSAKQSAVGRSVAGVREKMDRRTAERHRRGSTRWNRSP